MKHRRVFVALSFALVSAVAAPQAAAAEACQYQAHDLPLPAAGEWVYTEASSNNGRFILGSVLTDAGRRGLVWRDGELLEMAPLPAGFSSVSVEDVNNSGVVVGGMDVVGENGKRTTHPFRYQNGQYEVQPVTPGWESTAKAVNDAGDVVAWAWAGVFHRTTVWLTDRPSHPFDQVVPIGISNDRKLVVQEPDKWPVAGSVIDLETDVTTPLPEMGSEVLFDNDRILHPGNDNTIVELGLDGQRVATYAEGAAAYGKNNTGTVLGRSGTGETVLWQNGVRQRLESDKLPDPWYHGDVTDDGALIGTYAAAGRSSQPARWYCA